MRIQLRGVQRRHDLLMLHLQQDLCQSRNPRGRFAMPDIRLDRSDQTKLGILRALMKGFAQRRDLDRIAQLRSCAVGFDVADMPRVGVRFGECPADCTGLRLRVWDRVAIGLAAMIQRTASNDAVDVIAVSPGLGEAFQYDYANAFSGNISIAALAKALAMAVTRDELPVAEHQIFIRMDADIDPARNRQTGALVL